MTRRIFLLCLATIIPVSTLAWAADEPADAFTPEKAMQLAADFAKSKKLAWGDPEKAEKKDADTYWVFFPTPKKEEQLLYKRTLIVKRDGKVSFLPRR